MTPTIPWPEGKRFAFTVFDDTDSATLDNVRAVYSFLGDCGFRTTKSCWLRPGKSGTEDSGTQTCAHPDYLKWLLELQARGFEIGWHGVTWHDMLRDDVLRGLEQFAALFGHDPAAASNHNDEEGVYWCDCRLGGFRRFLYNVMMRYAHRRKSRGHVEGDPYFWGDACKSKVKYFRNFVFQDVNTWNACPLMPYHDPQRPCVNYWFASSEGGTPGAFIKRVSERNQDRLEEEGGACIMYTHFAYGFGDRTSVEPRFESLMRRLAKKNGWFVPVGTLLDHLLKVNGHHDISDAQRRRLEWRWLWEKMFVGST